MDTYQASKPALTTGARQGKTKVTLKTHLPDKMAYKDEWQYVMREALKEFGETKRKRSSKWPGYLCPHRKTPFA